MKRLFFAIIFFLAATATFAHTGIMWGEKDIKYISTEHFDIIYEPKCAESAVLLYENAERILEEVQDFFGAGEIRMRVPVVISANNQMFNAACGNVPYPLIYIYDTAIDESMAVFSDDLLSTFKHELTHAYTFNLKNGFWNGFSKVMGNVYNPTNIFVSHGMAEGATLTSESSTGEGRLNDEWSKQITRQAKIENKFPGYYDEQGQSTKYYAGDFYYFNGEFAKYLQETYGMEKYAQFWYKCANFQAFTRATAFHSVYGIAIWNEWKKFRDALPVPEYSEPFDVRGVKDFFSASNEKFSLDNNRGAIYKNLSVAMTGLFYLEYKTGNVYFVSNDDLFLAKTTGKKITPKKVFQKTNITNISVSSDGKFIAYDYYDSNSANYKYCAGIYDIEKKLHIKTSDHFKTPAIVTTDSGHYLLTINFQSQMKQIFVQKITGAWKEDYAIQLPVGVNVLSITDIGNGKFAMIVKSGMKWELCFGKIGEQNESNFEKVELPEEKMTMRYLSYSASNNSLYFSWTKPNSMPRIGKFSLDEKQFELSDKNISGGVYYPVRLPTESTTGETENIFFIGEFTKQNRIFSYTSPSASSLLGGETLHAEFTKKDFTEIPSDVTTLQNPVFKLPESPDEKTTLSDVLSGAKKYNPFKYYLHPVIVPASLTSSYSFDLRRNNFGDAASLPFGVTLISANPWGKGIAEMAAGLNPLTASAAIMASFQDSTTTNLFSYNILGQAEFDITGFKQAHASGTVSINLDWLSVSDSAKIFAGRGNLEITSNDLKSKNYFGNLKTKLYQTDNVLYFENAFNISFGKIVPYGCELFNKIGGVWSVVFENVYERTLTGNYFSYGAMNLGTKFDFYIPKLLPIKCYDRFAYNLPSVISLGAFTSARDVFNGGIKTTLFAYDIQKGIPFLFFNKIYIDAGYQFSFKYPSYGYASSFEIAYLPEHLDSLRNGKLPYSDKIFVNLNLILTPNIGMVQANFTTTFQFFYKPNPIPNEKNWGFNFNLKIAL